MAVFPDYRNHDGLGLADLVRKKEVSPLELVEAAIERIEALNPKLNAVIHKMYERGREAARGPLPEGAFAGVPFLLKDLMTAYAGEPLSSGSRFCRGWVPDRHTELARRFLKAGVIVLGKTNTPEFGLLPTTEPEAFGPTRNPWDTGRTPGGSSGGSAAAVASRMVPLASGGDGGGSIRIPASCCGLFGLKPTRGLNPVGPIEGEMWRGFVCEHVLTRTVRDSAAMLDATCGPDPGCYYYTPPPGRPFSEEVTAEPGRLRVAFTSQPFLSPVKPHPDCMAALQDAVTLLEGLGHEVVEAAPPIEGPAFARDMLIMIMGETWADIRDAEGLVGRKASASDFEDGTWVMRVLGKTFTAGEYASAVRALQRQARKVSLFMEDYDVMLTPTLAEPPVLLGSLLPKGAERVAQRVLGRLSLGGVVKALGAIDKVAEQVFAFMPYTPLFNATGQPSMSVPLYWNREGLPVGTLFTGRFGQDGLLFRLAGQLERARPWANKRPPLSA